MRIFTFLIALTLSAMPVYAQETSGVAVVDVQTLVMKSDAAQDIGKQLEEKRAAILKDLSGQEKALVEREKELVDSRNDLSKEEFARNVQDFEKEKIALQKLSVEQRNMLNQASVRAERELMDTVTQVVGEIADERNYALVVTKQSVIVGANSLEITDE